MAKFNRKLCERCRCVFCPDDEAQEYCVRCLIEFKHRDIKDKYEQMRCDLFGSDIENRICVVCEMEFKSGTNRMRKTCSDLCFSRIKSSCEKLKKSDYHEDVIKKNNEKWLNNERKEKKKGLSPDILNKKFEYKRVFDEKGWNHYLKGRKWDRI